jgi:hypothetical protein
VFPRDERMRSLIALKAFGLSEVDAVRYYPAMLMAQHGIISAPNMAIGQPFNINAGMPVLPNMAAGAAPAAPAPSAAHAHAAAPRQAGS